MADPQCENGYTRIANELLEALIGNRIPGQEMRVVLAIARKTYGYGKKQDQISYGQIAQLMNIPRVKVINHIKSLVLKRVLGSSHNGTRQPLTIWINKDFDKWKPSPPKGTSPDKGTIPSPVEGNRSSPHQGTHKRKKEIKRNISEFLPEDFSLTLWGEFKKHRTKIKKPMTDHAEELMAKKLKKYADEGYDPVDLIEKTIEKGWQDIKPEWIYKDGKPKPQKEEKLHCPKCHQEPSKRIVDREGGMCPACGTKLIGGNENG